MLGVLEPPPAGACAVASGWITAKWGTSDNNRKAKFYSITKLGQKQLIKDTAYWQRLARVVGRVLSMHGEGGEQ